MEIMLDGFSVKIPDDYQLMNSLPNDPENMMSFMKETDEAVCLAMYGCIPSDEAMPFNSPEAVINAIRGKMADDQGLIEVKSGLTTSGKKCIYSIVKTVNRDGISLQYYMSVHIGFYADKVFQTQAFFNETGIVGRREASVSAILKQDGELTLDGQGNIVSGWLEDPYDKDYKKGILMNTGERKEYDEAFPGHPLTQARLLVRELVKMN